ncbi:hypothetical protein [Roseovarius tolerans]|uniref:hypothetical protein n=1 Tax=Roseovarius tolerans TaxID=74031 RepID=UPI001113AD0F|nr:hypothetical protein [Roseovarius tolerans]
MTYKKTLWRPRNVLKPPKKVHKALDGIQTELVRVAVTKLISSAQLNDYRHLGMPEEEGAVVSTLPLAEMGKWSTRNREGWIERRTDLPKITKSRTFETPNFGDAATYGTHVHYLEQEVYQREHHEPRFYELEAELLKAGKENAAGLFRFALDRDLDRTSEVFEDELLLALNLLQENVGTCSVFASDASRDDYIRTVQMDWQFFPPGTRDEVVERLLDGGRISGEAARTVAERVALFERLEPQQYIRGAGGLHAYVGAKFADNLVVFENVRYGNALYVLYDDWEDVSQRSRLELLKGTDERFDRFVHTEGWEERFLELLRTKKRERGI